MVQYSQSRLCATVVHFWALQTFREKIWLLFMLAHTHTSLLRQILIKRKTLKWLHQLPNVISAAPWCTLGIVSTF